jgi:hypothetical protein
MNKVTVVRECVVDRYQLPADGSAQPIGERERIVSIDVLRGFAQLGILPNEHSVFFDDQRRVFQSDCLRKSEWCELLGMAVEPRTGGREVYDDLLDVVRRRNSADDVAS